MSAAWRHWSEAPRLAPLLGAAIGAAGGAVYWIGAQVWPTSVAVVLSMMATALLGAGTARESGSSRESGGIGAVGFVLAVLLQYNVLMALSAAKLPFPLPANLALGFIMIAGHASSRALAVTVPPAQPTPASRPPSHADLVIALLLGFVPAALIGIPGLIGLAAAVLARIAFAAHLRRPRPGNSRATPEITQPLAALCFYLGALASWAYV
jgi:cobalamin synthase